MTEVKIDNAKLVLGKNMNLVPDRLKLWFCVLPPEGVGISLCI